MPEQKITFELKSKPLPSGGTTIALIKVTTIDDKREEEEWCTTEDLDRLFDCAATKWPAGWDLEKVMTAIREADFE